MAMSVSRNKLLDIEAIFAAKSDSHVLEEALQSTEWRLVLAALHSIRLKPQSNFATAILHVLAQQDGMDVYGQQDKEFGWGAGNPDGYFPASLRDMPEATREIWKCRWRIKHAACLALGAIAAAYGAPALPKEACEYLCRYATSAREDYQVRAAACRALREINEPTTRTALEQAAQDEEWCTRTEAQKALAMMQTGITEERINDA